MSDHIKDRRSFLKTAVVASGAAAATGAIAARAVQPAETGDTVQSTKKPQAAGYRETAHIREYYRLARF